MQEDNGITASHLNICNAFAVDSFELFRKEAGRWERECGGDGEEEKDRHEKGEIHFAEDEEEHSEISGKGGELKQLV